MYNSNIQALIGGIVIASVFQLIASCRKAPTSGDKPRRLFTLTAKLSVADTMKVLVRFAQQSGYAVEVLDEANGRLVLSDRATLTSFGFFYLVFLKGDSVETLIEVGVKSKSFQVGPVATRSLERCVNGIRAAIFAEGRL